LEGPAVPQSFTYYYILIPLHAATILVIAGSSRRFGCGCAALWSRLSAGHDGFRAGVRPGAAVICGLGRQSKPDGIIFEVPAHTLRLALIFFH
jgi:hypothetical protein